MAALSIRHPDLTERATYTDADGSFSMAGFSAEKLVIAADREDLGRSLPKEIPEGEADARVELVLGEVGSLSGTVRLNGEPAGFCSITAYSGETKEQALSVQSGSDGKYLFARIPAGKTSVVAWPGGVGSYKIDRGEVVIHAGERSRLDFDFTQGDVDLQLVLEALPGARVDAAWVFLIPGRASPKTGADIRAIGKTPGNEMQMTFSRTAQGGRMVNLEPGDYTLCANPFTGDPDDSTYFSKVTSHLGEMKVFCQPLRITASPKEQTATLVLPEMEPLPE